MLTEIKKTVTSSSPVLETYKLNYYPDNNLSTLAIGLDTSSGVSTTIIYQYFYSQLNQLVQLKDGDNRILANYVYKDNNISVINSQNTEQKHNYHTFSNPFKKRKFLDGWYALPENAALWFSENALKSREIWVNGDLHETHNYSYKFDNNKLMEFADSSFIWNTVTVKKFNYSYNCQ